MSNYNIGKMSFLQRLFNATKTLVGAIYEASSKAYGEIIGRPVVDEVTIEPQPTGSVLDTVIPDLVDEVPITNLSVSDGSDVNLDFEGLDNDASLELILNSLDELTFINGQYYILQIDFKDEPSKNIIITADNLDKIKDKIKKAIEGVLTVETESDKITYSIVNSDPISATIISKHQQSILDIQWLENSGGLFLYRHNIDNPYMKELLESLEIYHKDSKCLPDLCFLTAIKGSVSETVFASIAKSLNCKRVSSKMIAKLCKAYDFRVKVITCDLKGKGYQSTTHSYGSSGEIINICLFEEHYFKYFNLPVDKRDDWSSYVDCNLGTSFATTLSLVKFLLKNKDKYLISLNETQQFYYRDKNSDFVGVDDIDSHVRLVTIPEVKEALTIPIVYFDFETSTDGNHNVYHLSFGIDYKDEFKMGRINGKPSDEIITTYLSALTDKFGVEEKYIKKPNILMLAHNSTYDTSFILPYLHNIEMCEKDGRYVSVSGCYRYFKKMVKIQIKDTLRLIPSGLGKFGKMFHLEQGKEVMYYSMYNRSTLPYITNVPLDEVKKYITEFNSKSLLSKSKLDKNAELFWSNVNKWRCRNSDGSINLLEYSAKYCDIDIKVLRNGLNKFRAIYLKIHPDIDPIHYYSLPSIANDLLLRSGCYEDTYELDGMIGDYFQPFIVGGRTMSSDNQKHDIREDSIAVDYNSLYPSAMKEFDGFLKGKPILLSEKQLNMEFLESVSHYFIEIKITKIGVHRSMPLMSKMNELDGTRQWDDRVMLNEKLKVDRYALEDLVKYQKIEYEILNGYYFNDGFNRNVNELMYNLYSGRIKDRSEGNESLAEVKKLTMNSSYGKTIQKPNTENKVIVDVKRFNKETRKYEVDEKVLDTYIGRNYNKIVDYRSISNIHGHSGKYLLTESVPLIESWNKAHQGAMILSYSKRLMNMSICLLEDLGMECSYQDTDSIHMMKKDYEKFMLEFEKRYGFNLSGDLQGQAKVDLDVYCNCDQCVEFALSKVKCEDGDAKKCSICRPKADVGTKCEDRVIKRSIICGKKSYYDRMEGKCRFTGKVITTEKGKLKGIPQDSIDAYIQDHRGKSREQLREMAKLYGYPEDRWDKYVELHYVKDFNMERMYELLYIANFAMRFDLSVNNKCRFDKSNSQVYSTGKPMVRRVWFLNRKADKYEKQRYWINGEPPIKEIDDSDSD